MEFFAVDNETVIILKRQKSFFFISFDCNGIRRY